MRNISTWGRGTLKPVSLDNKPLSKVASESSLLAQDRVGDAKKPLPLSRLETTSSLRSSEAAYHPQPDTLREPLMLSALTNIHALKEVFPLGTDSALHLHAALIASLFAETVKQDFLESQ